MEDSLPDGAIWVIFDWADSKDVRRSEGDLGVLTVLIERADF